MRHIIATAIVAVGMGFAVSCSDNPEPAPPTPTDHTQTENDNEIPLLTVAPTEYTGYENLRTFTSLGEEELGAEAHLILHWPKKNLKVFVRLYSKREDFDLPAGWHGRDRTEEGGFSITASTA